MSALIRFLSLRKVYSNDSSTSHLISQWFLSNWWVIGCSLLAYACYEGTSAQFRHDHNILSAQHIALQNEKMVLLEENLFLEKQLSSQNDPAWIELTLMKVLGVIPKEQKKVYFLNQKKK